jgi:hypothetical protein
LLKSVDVSSDSAVSLSYKSLLYHSINLEAFAIISRALQLPLHDSDKLVVYGYNSNVKEWREDPVSNVIWEPDNEFHSILPLQCTVVDDNILIEEEDGGVFEVQLLGNKIFPPRKYLKVDPIDSEKKVGSTGQFNYIEDDKMRGFVQQCSLSAQRYEQEMNDLQFKSKQFSVEMDFMANYFAQTWGVPVTENQKPENILHQVTEHKKMVDLEKDNSKDKQKKRKRDDENPLSEDFIPNPLVYFNVEGEIVPILRSTILRVIPQSQLAIRVSGRWQDQQSDVDEDANLIVRCPKEAFKHILASLQVHNPTRKENAPLEIFVNEYSKHAIEETLDFLQITPHFIQFLDCEF